MHVKSSSFSHIINLTSSHVLLIIHEPLFLLKVIINIFEYLNEMKLIVQTITLELWDKTQFKCNGFVLLIWNSIIYRWCGMVSAPLGTTNEHGYA